MENDETFALIGIIALPVSIFALILFFTITDYNFNEIQFSINDTNVSINESWIISVLNNSDITIDVNVNNTEHLEGRDTNALYDYFKGLYNNIYYSISNPYSFYNSTTLPPSEANFTNVAFLNQSLPFTAKQNFSNGLLISKTYGWAFDASPTTGVTYFPNNAFYIKAGGTNVATVTSGGFIGGDFTAGNALLGGQRTAGNPSYSFNSDTDTGMYRPNADRLGFSTGGTLRQEINSTDIVNFRPTEIRGGSGIANAKRILNVLSPGVVTGNDIFYITNVGNFLYGPNVNLNGQANQVSVTFGNNVAKSGGASYPFFLINPASTQAGDILKVQDGTVDVFRIQADNIVNISGNVSIGSNFLKLINDNAKMYWGAGDDASTYWDGTNMIFDTNASGQEGLAYFSDNVSATGFVTRTSVYDKSFGSALDKIKDADELVDTKGKINHSEFYGYTQFKVTDYSRPVEVEKEREICEELTDKKTGEVSQDCYNETYFETEYPYKKLEDGVELGMEIDLLRQGIVELRKQNQFLQEQINNLTGKDILITDANTRQDEAICTIKIFEWCIK